VWVGLVICSNTNLVHFFELAHTITEIFVSNVSMRKVLDFALIHIFLRWNDRWLKFWGTTSDHEMVWASLVICKNTNLVHPTWLAHTLFEIFVCSLSIRQVLDFAIIHNHFGSFSLQWPMFKILEHYRWSWGGVRDPCHMHKYKSCASSLARSHPPWDFCVQCKYIERVLDLLPFRIHF
jgi:hypothetical protein